MVDGMNKTKRL